MTLEEAVYAALAGDAAVAAAATGGIHLISSSGALPRDPTIFYSRVSTTPENSLSGYAGISNIRVSLDISAATPTACRSLAGKAKTAMAAYAGFKSLNIGDYDLHESEAKLYRAVLDFSVWFNE